MRIAFLTPEFVTNAPDYGGLGNYLNRVSAALAGRGQDVEIFTRAEQDDTINHNGILVHHVRAEVPRWLASPPWLPRHFHLTFTLENLWLAYRLRSAFLRRHQEAPFDIVQATQYNAPGLFLSLRGPVPTVTRISSFSPRWREANNTRLTLDYRMLEWLELLAMRRSGHIYAPSRCVAQIIRDHLGLQAHVIPPPMFIETEVMDESVYAQNLADRRYLLFFGRISRVKGLHILAEALHVVMPRCPDMHFVFIGKGRRDWLQKALPPFEDRIHFLGALAHPQLYPVIRHSQGIVLPSLIDNLPNTCLESMALGRPVIGTRKASFDELLVDGESGFLVEPEDPHGLADAMLRLWVLSDKELSIMGEAGKKALCRYSPEVTCAQLERFMSDVLGRTPQELTESYGSRH